MLNTPSDSATTMVANISQLARYIKAPAEAAQGEASQCWGDLVTPHQLRQQVDGCSNQLDLLGKEVKMLRKELARYAIPSEKVTADSIDYGSGVEDGEEGAGQVPHHQCESHCRQY